MARMLALRESTTYEKNKAIGSYFVDAGHRENLFLRKFCQFLSPTYPLKMTSEKNEKSEQLNSCFM